jgi:hypothetical protein
LLGLMTERGGLSQFHGASLGPPLGTWCLSGRVRNKPVCLCPMGSRCPIRGRAALPPAEVSGPQEMDQPQWWEDALEGLWTGRAAQGEQSQLGASGIDTGIRPSPTPHGVDPSFLHSTASPAGWRPLLSHGDRHLGNLISTLSFSGGAESREPALHSGDRGGSAGTSGSQCCRLPHPLPYPTAST